MSCCEGSLWCCVCTHDREHIVHMPVHTSYACPCTHHMHVRAHASYVRMPIHTSYAPTHAYTQTCMQLLHVFHFVAENLFYVVEEVCGAVCVYTSYTCPRTHPTHVCAHILHMSVHTSYACTCARIVCTYVHSRIVRSNAHIHANMHAKIHSYLTRIPTSARMSVQDTSTY